MKLLQDSLKKIKLDAYYITQSQVIRTFIGNIGTVFIFRFISAVLNLIGLILAARKLGAVSVGSIVMIQNTAYLLYIPMCFGINFSIIKYLPSFDSNESEKLLGSIGIWSLILTLVFTSIYMLFHSVFSEVMGFSSMQLALTVILAVLLSYSTISESILRSKKQFFLLGKIKLIGTLVFFACTLISSLVLKNYVYFVMGIILNQLVLTLLAIKNIKVKKLGFSMEISKTVYKYGGINTVSSILSYVMFSGDLLIINHFCSRYDVGIYSLYQVNVKNFFNLMFHEIFAVVFLPTVVQMDTVKTYQKIKFFIPVLIPFAIAANAALSIFLLLMYGKDYKFNWLYIILVSTSLGFHFIYWLLNSVFTVEGKKGALLCLAVLGIPLPFLIYLSITLTKASGITGMLVSSLITQLVLIFMFIFIIRFRHIDKSEQVEIIKF